MNHGKFNVLPWLGKVTTLVGLPDITDVEVDKATTDFAWKDHALHLTQHRRAQERRDADRAARSMSTRRGKVDGKLKLGLPRTITAKWPQLAGQVFPVQFEDYNWADVHLTGTPDHLQEDLTPRLLAAGLGPGRRSAEPGHAKGDDLFNNFMGK